MASHDERKALKIERTLVRLKWSLQADDELEVRRQERLRALEGGEDYVIDVPDLLGLPEGE